MEHPANCAPCAVCGGPTRAPFVRCFCCTRLVIQLQLPLVPLVAMADYRPGDGLHRRLRGYKDAPLAEARQVYLGQLVRYADGWLSVHRQDLERQLGQWDTVATVPSSRRPGHAPVDAIVGRLPALRGLHRPLLVRGPRPTDHLVADRRGFALGHGPGTAHGELGDRTVLVVDDCVTTGARAQSAAAALRIGGARVAGILAIGRAVGRVVGAPATLGQQVAAL